MNTTTRAFHMASQMADELLDYGPARSRLLVRSMRLLARGQPLDSEQIDELIKDLEIGRDEANQFLRRVTERDASDRIVGIMGLSLNDHPHHFAVNGVPLRTWCAADTLFLPSMLRQSASVESASPLSGAKIQVSVSPERVNTVSPAGAVVSIAIVSPSEDQMASVDAIWNSFCRQIFFFASAQEAEAWAAGRGDIEIVTVDEAFELGQRLWSRVLAYAD